jgi:transcriptional regulator GlxA family with amidase domain
MEFFRSYEWPGNASELERVAARMAIMLDGEEITLEAIYDHVPALAGARPLRSVARNHNPLELAQELLDGEPSSLNSIHPGLQKALRYMAAHFKEDISLNQLARQACVSASHLSYLFRNTIGISFKNFLATLRIESAKRLLAKDKSLNVTEVAARVGFSDLRHFRRTFNRLANCNPKEYRRRVGQCP